MRFHGPGELPGAIGEGRGVTSATALRAGDDQAEEGEGDPMVGVPDGDKVSLLLELLGRKADGEPEYLRFVGVMASWS